MSKRSDGLLADMLSNRWSFTDSKTNSAFTTALIGDTQSAKEQRHMDFFYLSILNKNTANHTVTATVKDSSAAGATLATFPFLVGASQVAQVSISDIHHVATEGKGFLVSLDTVAPSVTATCNAAGWTDSSHD